MSELVFEEWFTLERMTGPSRAVPGGRPPRLAPPAVPGGRPPGLAPRGVPGGCPPGLAMQGSLLDLCDEAAPGPLGSSPRRTSLSHGAWIDIRPGWMTGADVLFGRLLRGVAWRAERRPMYDRVVDVPRLLCFYDEDQALPEPALDRAREALSAHYRRELGEPFRTAGLWCSGGVRISGRSRSSLIDDGRSGQRILPMAAGHWTRWEPSSSSRAILPSLPPTAPGNIP